MADMNPTLPSMPITDIREKVVLDPKQILPVQNTTNGGENLRVVKPDALPMGTI